MRRLIAALALCATALPGVAQDLPDAAPPAVQAPPGLVVRAIRDDLDGKFVSWLAQNAEPRQLDRSAYPTLDIWTGNQIASAICGTVGPTYWSAVGKENGLTRAQVDELRNRRIGERAYAIRWPACLFVERGAFAHDLLPGESLPVVYNRNTGSKGQPSTWSHFFRRSSRAVLADPDAGEQLRYGFRTQDTLILPRGDPKIFSVKLAQIASETKGSPANTYRMATDSGDAKGEIVLPVDWGSVATETAGDDCANASVQPIPLLAITEAYRIGPFNFPDDIDLVVADNGFNGGHSKDGAITLAPLFDRRFFRILHQGAREVIGPTITYGPDRKFRPLNSENGLDEAALADPASGHGTHVLALALGGPMRGTPGLFPNPADSWLRASVLPLAPGTRDVPTYSLGQLNEAMRQIQLYRGHVINMSVRFGLGGKVPLESLIAARSDTLFVVAAGNEGRDLDRTNMVAYPAQLGRDRRVITVAAEDGAGNLTAFSNRSSSTVTLAAPGCAVQSTLDGKVEAPLSGTSQATPMVSFAAALLIRGNIAVGDVKRRLALSGDLLDSYREKVGTQLRQISATRDAEVPVLTRSRLNLVKALYIGHDYLRYRDESGAEVAVLGEIESASGPSCGESSHAFGKVLAFKRSRVDDTAWCFWGGELAPRPLSPTEAHKLRFNVRYAIGPDGAISAEQRIIADLSLTRVREFILSNELMEELDPS